jgi:hypothetical protein
MYKPYFKIGTYLALIFFILSALSVCFIDKTLALHIHSYGIDQWLILSYITEYGIQTYIFICIAMLFAAPNNLSVSQRLLLVVYTIVILLFAKWLRAELGIILGRSWPLTWAYSGPYGSFISDNDANFHFLKSSTFKGSFPSGHSLAITLLCCSFYLAYKRYFLLWFVPVILIPVCLILLNYHYLGDTLAGVGLGLLLSYYGFAGYCWLSQTLGLQPHVKN